MDRVALLNVAEATWPAETRVFDDPWIFRQSPGGGKRVNAASTTAEVSAADVRLAEERMIARGQNALFSVSPSQPLDPILAELGYRCVDMTLIYDCPIEQLTDHDVPPVTAFPTWPPLQLARDIWLDAGIGQDRVAVMERASCEKTAILGRVNDRAGGVVYAGLSDECVMVHALEVIPAQRRFGLATSLIVAAAHWGAARGAKDLALLVTAENEAANSLYQTLGMQGQAGYHYRVKP